MRTKLPSPKAPAVRKLTTQAITRTDEGKTILCDVSIVESTGQSLTPGPILRIDGTMGQWYALTLLQWPQTNQWMTTLQSATHARPSIAIDWGRGYVCTNIGALVAEMLTLYSGAEIASWGAPAALVCDLEARLPSVRARGATA